MRSPDVVVAGAGLIGLSCALELKAAGLEVMVLERGRAAREASWAAAGMLAAHDACNPPELQAIAEHSVALYPDFLEIVAETGGGRVPFETEWVLEQAEGWQQHRAVLPTLEGKGFRRIAERSLDPRKLVAAVREAARIAGVTVKERTPVRAAFQRGAGVEVRTDDGAMGCGSFLDCSGAWSAPPVRPAKGQMLKLVAPGTLASHRLGNVVVRTPDIYLVPRLDGSVVVGATVEDAAFDRTVHEKDIQQLRAKAAALLPALREAAEVERWCGLRPDTPDHLPILGRTGEHSFVAAGHFRNGILLAPATAQAMTDLILGEAPAINLESFRPERFASGETRGSAIFAQT